MYLVWRNGNGHCIYGTSIMLKQWGVDSIVPIGIMGVLSIMIMPMSSWMLDGALSISFGFSVLILMMSLLVAKPMEFNILPTILLISTMLRLGLNMSSTRLILSEGHKGSHAAGQVIEAFGQFVMGGNFLIGIIIFAILIIVNFIVITKGSGRISEVTARFTLDAMPGKQMAIDADLNAGLLDEAGAKKKRQDLEKESTFYGAMDGASKFVKGDAIAGLMITVINIVGGVIIGTVQKGLSFSQALDSYTLLTIGDGLVSQIPALIVSTAAGLIITKSGMQEPMGKMFGEQFGNYPKALGLTGFIMLLMGLFPGIPVIPFFALGGTLMGISYWLIRRDDLMQIKAKQKEQKEISIEEEAKEKEIKPKEFDPIRVALGINLLTMTRVRGETGISHQLNLLRRQLFVEYGFIMPSVRIVDDVNLGADNYIVYIKDIQAAKASLEMHKLLAISSENILVEMDNVEHMFEPSFGLPAAWINPAMRETASYKGYAVIEPSTVLVTHITELVKSHMSELMSLSYIKAHIAGLPKEKKQIIEEFVPSQITWTLLQSITQNLLAECVPVRDWESVVEYIAQIIPVTTQVAAVTEYVRSKMARQICQKYQSEDGVLRVVILSAKWEEIFHKALMSQEQQTSPQLSISPEFLEEFIGRLEQVYKKFSSQKQFTLLVSAPLRVHIRYIVDRMANQIPVISHQEIYHKIRLETLDYL